MHWKKQNINNRFGSERFGDIGTFDENEERKNNAYLYSYK